MLEALGNFFSQPLFRKEVRQPAETQGDFKIDGWEYGSRENVKQLCERVEKRTSYSAKKLLEAFDKGGGKALGLLFCELIAKRCQDVKVEVPRWKILTAQEVARLPREEEVLLAEMNKLGFEYPILRSSDQEEDWLSAAAGTHASHVLRKRPGPVDLPSIPHIVQHAYNGYGVVIDVVQSPLLGGKTVVKVSSGRREKDSRFRFTSATNDPEATAVVLDPMNGSVVLEQQSFGHVTALDDQNIKFGALASNIRAAAAAIGIDFGIQFEFIVDSNNKNKIWLVQIRPSPEKIQPLKGDARVGGKQNGLENPEAASELLFRTNIVNGPFDLKQGVKTVHLSSSTNSPSAQDLYRLRVPGFAEVEAARNGQKRMISFYPKVRGEFLGPDTAARTFLADYSLGTEGVIVKGPIWPSTTHTGAVDIAMNGSHRETLQRQKTQAYLQPRLAMMSVTEDQAALLGSKLSENPQAVLHLVSDGIVGEVRLLTSQE